MSTGYKGDCARLPQLERDLTNPYLKVAAGLIGLFTNFSLFLVTDETMTSEIAISKKNLEPYYQIDFWYDRPTGIINNVTLSKPQHIVKDGFRDGPGRFTAIIYKHKYRRLLLCLINNVSVLVDGLGKNLVVDGQFLLWGKTVNFKLYTVVDEGKLYYFAPAENLMMTLLTEVIQYEHFHHHAMLLYFSSMAKNDLCRMIFEIVKIKDILTAEPPPSPFPHKDLPMLGAAAADIKESCIV